MKSYDGLFIKYEVSAGGYNLEKVKQSAEYLQNLKKVKDNFVALLLTVFKEEYLADVFIAYKENEEKINKCEDEASKIKLLFTILRRQMIKNYKREKESPIYSLEDIFSYPEDSKADPAMMVVDNNWEKNFERVEAENRNNNKLAIIDCINRILKNSSFLSAETKSCLKTFKNIVEVSIPLEQRNDWNEYMSVLLTTMREKNIDISEQNYILYYLIKDSGEEDWLEKTVFVNSCEFASHALKGAVFTLLKTSDTKTPEEFAKWIDKNINENNFLVKHCQQVLFEKTNNNLPLKVRNSSKKERGNNRPKNESFLIKGELKISKDLLKRASVSFLKKFPQAFTMSKNKLYLDFFRKYSGELLKLNPDLKKEVKKNLENRVQTWLEQTLQTIKIMNSQKMDGSILLVGGKETIKDEVYNMLNILNIKNLMEFRDKSVFVRRYMEESHTLKDLTFEEVRAMTKEIISSERKNARGHIKNMEILKNTF